VLYACEGACHQMHIAEAMSCSMTGLCLATGLHKRNLQCGTNDLLSPANKPAKQISFGVHFGRTALQVNEEI
jgi:hypothetical protein